MISSTRQLVTLILLSPMFLGAEATEATVRDHDHSAPDDMKKRNLRPGRSSPFEVNIAPFENDARGDRVDRGDRANRGDIRTRGDTPRGEGRARGRGGRFRAQRILPLLRLCLPEHHRFRRNQRTHQWELVKPESITSMGIRFSFLAIPRT